MEMDKLGHGIQEVESYRGGTEIKIYKTRQLGIVASLAIEMANRWGMVAATADGEDSAGRSQLRPLTPNEIVSKAINTAEMLYEELCAKGLVQEVPMPKPHRTEDEEDAHRRALKNKSQA